MFLSKIQNTWRCTDFFFKATVFFGIIFFLGDVMNALVCMLNEGKMPMRFYISAYSSLDENGDIVTEKNSDRLVMLCDWIPINRSGIYQWISDKKKDSLVINLVSAVNKLPPENDVFLVSPGDILRWTGLTLSLVFMFLAWSFFFLEFFVKMFKLDSSYNPT